MQCIDFTHIIFAICKRKQMCVEYLDMTIGRRNIYMFEGKSKNSHNILPLKFYRDSFTY